MQNIGVDFVQCVCKFQAHIGIQLSHLPSYEYISSTGFYTQLLDKPRVADFEEGLSRESKTNVTALNATCIDGRTY